MFPFYNFFYILASPDWMKDFPDYFSKAKNSNEKPLVQIIFGKIGSGLDYLIKNLNKQK